VTALGLAAFCGDDGLVGVVMVRGGGLVLLENYQ
jgi:hypothetical protein